jgi:hypothetical protein
MDRNRRGKVERGARGEKGQAAYAKSGVEQVRGGRRLLAMFCSFLLCWGDAKVRFGGSLNDGFYREEREALRQAQGLAGRIGYPQMPDTTVMPADVRMAARGRKRASRVRRGSRRNRPRSRCGLESRGVRLAPLRTATAFPLAAPSAGSAPG